mgnify:CR=1 FL=1
MNKKILLVTIFISMLFSISTSRISTTLDPPSDFLISLFDANNQLINDFNFNTKEGFNIAYEHMITKGGVIDGFDFYLFGGGEFMVGRRSDVNVSLHSLFLKPMIGFSDRFRLSTSLGLAILNSDQKDFILDKGTLLTIGFEYGITNNLSLSINKSYYSLFEKTYSSSSDVPSTPFLGTDLGGTINLENTILDMKYEKVGISIIYGFKTK